MTSIKTSIALIALAAGVAACGSTATAASTKPVGTQSVNYNTAGPCNDLPGMLTEPKTTPPTPTADSCWANGLYVGSGSLQSKQIVFASKMADLMQYEATSALFTNPKAWAAWKAKAGEFIDQAGITNAEAELARLLNKNTIFSLPPGNPVQNSGLAKTTPSECQSSVIIAKQSPSPQYLVGEQNVTQKSVTNGKLSTSSLSWTDVISKVGNNYVLVHILGSSSQVPPCVG